MGWVIAVPAFIGASVPDAQVATWVGLSRASVTTELAALGMLRRMVQQVVGHRLLEVDVG
jgi:hypothetical protein